VGLFEKLFSTLFLFPFLFTSFKKIKSKIFNVFTLFISHQSYFITISNKKIHYKTKFFYFSSYKTFSNFISHQSLHIIKHTNIPQHNKFVWKCYVVCRVVGERDFKFFYFLLLFLFFTFFNNNQRQNILIFFTIYITSIIF
jgi:hypothetical protein